jgi:hypothetical protein
MAYGGHMARKQSDDSFSEREAARRLETALRGARVAGHKSMKEVQGSNQRRKSKRSKKK